MKINLAENWKVKCRKLGIEKEVNIPFGVQSDNKSKGLSLKFVKYFSLKCSKEQKKDNKKKQYILEFDGVNTNAVVVLNGQKVGEHSGGFLPFSINVTDNIKVNGQNKLVVFADNKPKKDIPATGVTKITEYEDCVGIIRDVNLIQKDRICFGSKEGDDCFIYNTKKVEDGNEVNCICAELKVSTKNKNILSQMHVVATLFNNRGELINKEISNYRQNVNEDGYTISMPVKNAELWSPEYPYLYNLKLELLKTSDKTQEYEVVDTIEAKRGIREFSVKEGKFYVNGKPTEIKGICHHQEYPVVGRITSKNAEYREVIKLKKAGFNTIRLLYYPASKEFYEACDALGMMVINCMPTNGAFYDTYYFKENVCNIYKEVSLRNRNYTSVAMWEATLFETSAKQGMTDALVKKCVKQIKSAFPKGANPIVVGDTTGRKNPEKIGYDIAYCKFDEKEKTYYNVKGVEAGLISRYGAEVQNGNNANIFDELGMVKQAWNYQYLLNKNSYVENCVGAIVENDIDYSFAKGKKTSNNGLMTSYRLPKTSYYFYASQVDNYKNKVVYMPEVSENDLAYGVPVFTNCDYIKVYVNGTFVNKFEREMGGYTKFQNGEKEKRNKKNKDKPSKYSEFIESQLYNGSNSDGLKYPPIMVHNVDLLAEDITIEGYIDNCLVAQQIINKGKQPVALKISVDYSGFALKNDGKDFVFVYVFAIDDNGNIVNIDDIKVKLSISGGSIITNDQALTKAGVCAFIIKADKGAEQVELSATCEGELEQATAQVRIKM